MSNEPSQTNASSNGWIFAFIFSVALNGLLIGLLMSNHIGPKARHMKNGAQKSRPALSSSFDHPHKLLRRLEPKRRREILASAMNHTRNTQSQPSRELMQALRKTRKQTFALLRSPDLDAVAFEAQLLKTRQLKDKLGRQGDALVLEIFKQLTPEERRNILRKHKKGHKKRLND